jgi:hypothetical protein
VLAAVSVAGTVMLAQSSSPLARSMRAIAAAAVVLGVVVPSATKAQAVPVAMELDLELQLQKLQVVARPRMKVGGL